MHLEHTPDGRIMSLYTISRRLDKGNSHLASIIAGDWLVYRRAHI